VAYRQRDDANGQAQLTDRCLLVCRPAVAGEGPPGEGAADGRGHRRAVVQRRPAVRAMGGGRRRRLPVHHVRAVLGQVPVHARPGGAAAAAQEDRARRAAGEEVPLRRAGVRGRVRAGEQRAAGEGVVARVAERRQGAGRVPQRATHGLLGEPEEGRQRQHVTAVAVPALRRAQRTQGVPPGEDEAAHVEQRGEPRRRRELRPLPPVHRPQGVLEVPHVQPPVQPGEATPGAPQVLPLGGRRGVLQGVEAGEDRVPSRRRRDARALGHRLAARPDTRRRLQLLRQGAPASMALGDEVLLGHPARRRPRERRARLAVHLRLSPRWP
jgi:hypothetical protein